MPYQGHGEHQAPDHLRVHRADEPRLRGPVPAMHTPLENANQVLAKVGITMNRGGSSRGNPILSGLGVRFEYALGVQDSPTAVYLYQDRASLGASLLDQVLNAAPGIVALEFLAGAGTTIAGSQLTGAKRNLLRWETKRGTIEREFWVKEKEADAVTVNGFTSVDPETMDPVAREVPQIGGGPWIAVPVDFMTSWGDEFHALHRDGNAQIEPGFEKAYGGAAFVSFFDEDPGTEGVGGDVEAIDQQPIKTLRQINVQNTPGLKKMIARFRSKVDSVYFVDVPVWIQVLGAPTVLCNSPETHGQTTTFLKCGDPPPPDWPGVPGTPADPGDPHGPPPTPWGGGPVAQPLALIEMRGSTVGIGRIGVRRWKYEAQITDPNGARMVQVGDDQMFTTLQTAAVDTPLGAPYADPVKHRIALDWDQMKADDVAMVEVWLDDDTLGTPLVKRSRPIVVMGPKARNINGFSIPPGT